MSDYLNLGRRASRLKAGRNWWAVALRRRGARVGGGASKRGNEGAEAEGKGIDTRLAKAADANCGMVSAVFHNT